METVPLNVEPNPVNQAYLKTKDKLGHNMKMSDSFPSNSNKLK